MKRKILIALVCLLTISLPFGSSAFAKNEKGKIDQIKKENNKLSQQLRQNKIEAEKHKSELAKLDDDIEKADKQLQSVESELTTVEQKINKSKSELQLAAEALKEQDGLYRKRVRAMYKNGSMGYISILLAADDFGDFLGRLYTIQKIAENDKEIIAEIQEKQEAIAAKKEKLEAESVLLANARQSVEAKKGTLEVATRNKQVRIKEIQQSNVELEKQIDENNKEAKALTEIIKKRSVKTKYQGGSMLWPVAGHYQVSSPYGNRKHPILGKVKFHSGIDIPAPQGTSIQAANGGVVIFAGWQNGYGNFIVVDHGGGQATAYAHCSRLVAREGQKVEKGDVIAKVGTTGYSTGPHLHFEVRINGETINPMSKF